MAIHWKWVWFTTDGSPFISIEDWVDTLSIEDQNRYRDANIRQKAYRQEKINEGNLVVADDGYIWKDETAEVINKVNDPIWLEYWDRWQIETSSRWRMVREEI
jgi:hypothetical protein